MGYGANVTSRSSVGLSVCGVIEKKGDESQSGSRRAESDLTKNKKRGMGKKKKLGTEREQNT